MPSAHTQFMMFLAVCIPLILRTQRGFERTVATLIGWVAAVFVAYSRVHMEHHTIKQVVAGAFVGITVGVLWRFVAMRFVERFVVPLCKKSHFITHTLGFTSLYDGQSKIRTK
jgi:dolichyldiphosphatase